jgi:hypothetical protein
MQHFRKYAFADWATSKTAIQVTTEDGTFWNQDLVSCVVEIGHLCTQWGTDAEGLPVCEATDPLYAVDIVWNDTALAAYESALVWPNPVGVNSFGYTLDTEYAQAFCVANPDAAYCQPPAPFDI